MSLSRLARIGLGSNLDEPVERIHEALARLAESPDIELQCVSRLYRTPPWGVLEQPPFVNAVARLASPLDPQALLDRLLGIEAAMGRQRREVWGPRRIDLDLLQVDGCRVNGQRLQLPHPRLRERAFVLVPWSNIEPDVSIDGVGCISELLDWVDCSGIEPLP